MKTAVVIGGSGGIGGAVVDALQHRYSGITVSATYHRSTPPVNRDRLKWFPLDVRDPAAIQTFAETFAQVDWLINCVGLLHDGEKGPEKSIRTFDSDFLLKNIEVNTIPTLTLARYFSAALKKSPSPIFATVSARVGSIEDNRLGGWYSYRISKAALNMALKTLSIEWRHSHRNGCVVALHPGTNRTRLSQPFLEHVPPDSLLEPSDTGMKILQLFEKLGPAQSGQFWTWEGNTLPW